MVLKEGRLGIVDELDAKLHPKLLRNVIRLFTNPADPPRNDGPSSDCRQEDFLYLEGVSW